LHRSQSRIESIDVIDKVSRRILNDSHLHKDTLGGFRDRSDNNPIASARSDNLNH
jgi:hypothetical protein